MYLQMIWEFNIGHKKNSSYYPVEQSLVQLRTICSIVCWHDIEMNEDHNLLYLPVE